MKFSTDDNEERAKVAETDITQIRMGKDSVGLIGLKGLMEEMAPDYGDTSDEEIQSYMLQQLSKKNYISPTAREDYKRAFVREFRKFMGQPYVEAAPVEVDIKVLGPGCSQCDSMEEMIMSILAEIQLPASVDHVRDMKQIARYGVMGVPALLINGKVVCTGSVPPKNKLKNLLVGAKSRLEGNPDKK